MTPRQRVLKTLRFSNPDRIPLAPGGPRESTLMRWYEEGLPKDVGWATYLWDVLGIETERHQAAPRLGVDFRMIPQFEERVLEHAGGHYIVQDWKGNICEIADTFDVTYLRVAKDFVTRRWLKCPVENREDWEQMRSRYEIDAPDRWPEDFARRARQGEQRETFLWVHFPGPFWQMREWCGFEGLCMMMIDQPEFVAEMAAFWTQFVADVLDRILTYVVPDGIHISEDMAYKEKAMISPEMTRRFCKPSWDRWVGQCRTAGVPIIGLDSDGYIGELIPLWIESGVNVCDPIEVAAGNDINAFRAKFGRRMAYRGGVDKRAIAKGGRTLRHELKRIERVVRDGGYIPGCDHGVPSDVSWPNFVEYVRQLAQMTGWL